MAEGGSGGAHIAFRHADDVTCGAWQAGGGWLRNGMPMLHCVPPAYQPESRVSPGLSSRRRGHHGSTACPAILSAWHMGGSSLECGGSLASLHACAASAPPALLLAVWAIASSTDQPSTAEAGNGGGHSSSSSSSRGKPA